LRHSIADRELRDLVHIDFAFPRRVSIGADEALHFLLLAQLDFSLAKSSTGAAVVPLQQLDQVGSRALSKLAELPAGSRRETRSKRKCTPAKDLENEVRRCPGWE
jgi:hypothetical protein